MTELQIVDGGKSEPKISESVAESEFERWADAVDIEYDEKVFDEASKNEFERNKTILVREIQRGSLVISDEGEATYTPWKKRTKDKTPMTFREKEAGDLVIGDRKGMGDVTLTINLIARLTGRPFDSVKGLAGRDLTVVQTIFSFLV